VNHVMRLGLVALLSIAATGCVYVNGENVGIDDWKKEQRVNREEISNLEIGMTRGAVVNRLGTPSDSEAFSHEGEEVRVLFYRTRHKNSDGETSRDETTPLVFKNDLLLGWGDGVYADLRH
jgi:hypothetical protein